MMKKNILPKKKTADLLIQLKKLISAEPRKSFPARETPLFPLRSSLFPFTN